MSGLHSVPECQRRCVRQQRFAA